MITSKNKKRLKTLEENKKQLTQLHTSIHKLRMQITEQEKELRKKYEQEQQGYFEMKKGMRQLFELIAELQTTVKENKTKTLEQVERKKSLRVSVRDRKKRKFKLLTSEQNGQLIQKQIERYKNWYDTLTAEEQQLADQNKYRKNSKQAVSV